MKRRKWIPVCAALLFGCCLALGPGAKVPGAQVEAKSKVVKKDRTPKEPGSSDLKVVQTVTKLSSRRWIQSFTYDSRYYYFIQMTKPSVGNLRITRVKYKGLGKYTTAKMDASQVKAIQYQSINQSFRMAGLISGPAVTRPKGLMFPGR